MKNLWKKIIVWSLILSLVIPADIFLDGRMPVSAAEAGEGGEEPAEPKAEQKITVTCDLATISEDGTIDLSYGQEIFLKTDTDGDGTLSYLVAQTPEEPDLAVIETEPSGEITDKTADPVDPGDPGNPADPADPGDQADTADPANQGKSGDGEEETETGAGETGDTDQDDTDEPEKDEDPEKGILLKAVGLGSAQITVTASETDACQEAETVLTVRVGKADHDLLVKADGEEILSEYTRTYSEEPFSLEAVSESAAAENAELSFQSSKKSVAAIDENGLVTMKGLGSTTITVTASETTHYASTAVKFKLTVATSLPAPVIKSLANQDGSIKLKWNKVSDAEGYFIYRKVSSGAWEKIADIPDSSTVTFVDTGVTEGKSNSYKIKAYAYAGVDISGYSEKKSIRYLHYPSFCLIPVSAGNKVMWEKSSGASYYRIYRRENASQSWKKVKQVASTSSFSWTDQNVSNGKTYFYTIRAFYATDSVTSQSVVAPEQSIFYLKSPSIKKFSRKSATKMLVQWSKNTQAGGYELQYARNSLFAGAKTVTVKKNTTVSKTLSKLAKKKTYYVRVRAFKNVGGTTCYSAWTLHKNAIKQKTASKSTLKKKKKVFELRQYTKQVLYQYDTVQGGCTDGTYAYFAMFNRNVDKCKVVKIKLSNLKVVKVSAAMKLDHGNDMTYNPDTKKLLVLHTDPNHMRVSTINKSTLKLESSRDIEIPSVLMGASDKERKAIKGFSGIAYSSRRKQYVLRQRGAANLVICDTGLNPVSFVRISANDYMYQGMDATDDYVLLGRSPYGKYASNAFSVYTWDGEYVTDIKVSSGYELENIFHVNNQFYTGFYCSYYKTYYTKEKQTVYVRGKKKKVTVKVKHRKFVRDNYIYKLGNM